MGGLRIEEIEAYGSRFRALGADAMPNRLLGILGNEIFQFALCPFVVEKRAPGAAE